MSRTIFAARAPHWAEIDECTSVRGMRLLLRFYRWFGRRPFQLLLSPVVLLYMVTQPAARRASREYLCRLAAQAKNSRRPAYLSIAHHFAAFAETLLDKLLLWGGGFDTRQVKFLGGNRISEQIASGRGGIIICAHFGNLELCRVLSRREPNLRLTVLTHTLHAASFNRFLAQLDPQSQVNLLQVTEITPATAMMLAAKVECGEFVALAGDRIPVSFNGRVATARFLGATAAFPIGPYVLASLFNCPVYTLFALRRGSAMEVHLELFRSAICLPRRDRQPALQSLAAEYAARLERFCLLEPYQWFNFYDFWRMPESLQCHRPAVN